MMIRFFGILISVMWCLSLGVEASLLSEDFGHVNIFLGHKTLDESDWKPVEQQIEYGLDFDINVPVLKFNLALTYLRSEDDGEYLGDIRELVTKEFRIGLRKYIDFNKDSGMYIGLGTVRIMGMYTEGTIEETEEATGYYIELGALDKYGDSFIFGAKIDYSHAEGELLGERKGYGGFHAGFFLGFSF